MSSEAQNHIARGFPSHSLVLIGCKHNYPLLPANLDCDNYLITTLDVDLLTMPWIFLLKFTYFKKELALCVNPLFILFIGLVICPRVPLSPKASFALE